MLKLNCAVLLMVAVLSSTSWGYSLEDVVIEYGVNVSAPNQAIVVIDFSSDESYAFSYGWSTGAPSGWDALEAIDLAGDLNVTADEYTWGHLVQSFEYGEATTGAGTSWGYYLSPIGEAWDSAQVGCDGRTLVDGEFDGWSWGNVDAGWSHLRAPTTPVGLAGDSDDDGDVDLDDLSILASHWYSMVSNGPAEGDFDSDNDVDLSDLSILADNWNVGTSASMSATVPEPASISVLVIAGAGLLARRRRRSV